jgi:hypothetical protein
MFNGIEIPGIQFQHQKMHDETEQNNKSNINKITMTGDEKKVRIVFRGFPRDSPQKPLP